MEQNINTLKDLMFRLVEQQAQLVVGSTEYKKRRAEIKALTAVIKKQEHRSLFNRIFNCKKNSL